MALINMTVYPRSTTGKNANRRTRAAGRTPAVIYGDQREESLTVELETAELEKALTQTSGQNLLMSLSLEGDKEPFVAVLREMQAHPVSDIVYHCDLLQIPLGVPLTLEIGVNIEGNNKWVKGGDALLDVVRRTVEVSCLPREVPDNITVDITELEINDRICVSDLSLEKGTIITDGEEVVVKINPNLIIDVDDEVAEGDEDAEGVEGEEGAEGAEGAEGGDEEKSD